jgi:hypothetical protein
MPLSRNLAALAAAVGAALSGACGDPPTTAPPTLSTYDLASDLADDSARGQAPTSGRGGANRNTHTVTFTVYPDSGATIAVDAHRIEFGPQAICDPARSSYGPAVWDAPCDVANRGVRITATSYVDAQGRPAVDFEPALRFNPASRVTLFLLHPPSAGDPRFQILWRSPNGTLVDESAVDPSLATRSGAFGYKYRRIKHFSGYTVSTSRASYLGVETYLRSGSGPAHLGGPPGLGSGHVVATGALPRAPLDQ